MLRSTKELRGYTIQAIDGEIGSVHEFYFRDDAWVIRYLVVKLGNWLLNRKVLISPIVIDQPKWHERALPIALTKKRIENSPDINTEKTISQEMEDELRQYYGWPLIRNQVHLVDDQIFIIPRKTTTAQEKEESTDIKNRHLRSTREIVGYHIQAVNDKIGHVEDFILNDEDWTIRYLVVNTGNWLPGKKVLISLGWIEDISWSEEAVYVMVRKEDVKNSPEYNPETPINREYEEVLYNFYGKPYYWK